MIFLLLGLVLFLGVHSVRIGAAPWRAAQIARVGEGKWKGVFSLVSLVGFFLVVWGYGQARLDPLVLWSPPMWTRHVAAPLTFAAFVLIAAAYVPGTRIKATIGHPMVAGVTVWALAHLIANGMLADVVLFGGFLMWAIALFAISRRRDREAGTVYPAGALSRDALAAVIGGTAWIVFALWLHLRLIGVRPLG